MSSNSYGFNTNAFVRQASGLVVDQFENLDVAALIGWNDKVLDNTDREWAIPRLTNFSAPVNFSRQFLLGTSPTYDSVQFMNPVFSMTTKLEYTPRAAEEFRKNLPMVDMSYENILNSLRNMGIAQKLYWITLFGTGNNDGIANTVPLVPYTFTNPVSAFTDEEKVAFLQFLLNKINEIQSAMLNMGDTLTIVTSIEMANFLAYTILPLQWSQMAGAGVDSMAGTFTRVIENAFNSGHTLVLQATNSMADIVEQTPNATNITHGMLLFYPKLKQVQGNGLSNKEDGTGLGIGNKGVGLANTTMASLAANEIAYAPLPREQNGTSQSFERRMTVPSIIRENTGVFLELTYKVA